ncbi:hypothetical protein EW145_g5337 [Phellinidium pouzarii]|uniref:Uncharacterized protein n=1 Tax=Phellinidium pouzarii TaxID=167371 RepID=A0A4S4L0C6_9AGAM|nr:hypothetical protein EW145_g5337 [Phellinidium pouzarii]
MPILRRRLRINPQLPPGLAGDGLSRPDESTSASRKKRKKILHAIPVVLRELLRTLKESSDFCPPLKSAIGGLSHIIETVETMKGNKDDAFRLFHKVEDLLNLLADLIPDCENVPPQIVLAVSRLDE